MVFGFQKARAPHIGRSALRLCCDQNPHTAANAPPERVILRLIFCAVANMVGATTGVGPRCKPESEPGRPLEATEFTFQQPCEGDGSAVFQKAADDLNGDGHAGLVQTHGRYR